MSDVLTAWLGLGSNVGDKPGRLRAAVAALDAHAAIRVREASRIYRTRPMYRADQDWFLNAVVRVECRLEPRDLLAAVKRVERDLGRIERERFGPREIDIDLLLVDDRRMETPELTLPHPRMRERAFVLRPLADLASDAVIAADGTRAAAALAALEDDRGVEPFRSEPLLSAAGEWLDVESRGPEETERLGGVLAGACRGGEAFALVGGLGAGKTCFTRGFARALGVARPVQSPTFTLCRDYEEGRLSLHHWDFYRLETAADVESTGFYESLEDARGVALVEWADRCPEVWDFPATRLWIRTLDDDRRLIGMRPACGALKAAARAFQTADRDSQSAVGTDAEEAGK